MPRSPPIAALTDAELRQADVQEGFSVDLHPAASIPAVVSFTPGVERRVFFSIAGVALKRAGVTTGVPGPGVTGDAASDHALLRSLPVTVVADPSPTKPHAGVVLSVAPLLGANPSQDRGMPKWLHVHVRPSVRGLLRVLKVRRRATGAPGRGQRAARAAGAGPAPAPRAFARRAPAMALTHRSARPALSTPHGDTKPGP